MATKADLHKARMNGEGHRQKGQPVPVDDVVELLDKASQSNSTGLRQAANDLLERMAAQRWLVVAGKHEGGTGSTSRPADPNEHITVRIDKSYHLRLTASGYISQITGSEKAEAIAHWLSPGSPVVPVPRKKRD